MLLANIIILYDTGEVLCGCSVHWGAHCIRVYIFLASFSVIRIFPEKTKIGSSARLIAYRCFILIFFHIPEPRLNGFLVLSTPSVYRPILVLSQHSNKTTGV